MFISIFDHIVRAQNNTKTKTTIFNFQLCSMFNPTPKSTKTKQKIRKNVEISMCKPNRKKTIYQSIACVWSPYKHFHLNRIENHWLKEAKNNIFYVFFWLDDQWSITPIWLALYTGARLIFVSDNIINLEIKRNRCLRSNYCRREKK